MKLNLKFGKKIGNGLIFKTPSKPHQIKENLIIIDDTVSKI